MPFKEPPEIHGGLRTEPTGPVSVGVRRRGKEKKLTAFVAIEDSVLQAHLGPHLRLLIGGGKDLGQIMLKAVSEPESANVAAKLMGRQWFIETRKIPLGALDQTVRKTGIDFKANEELKAIILSLPWLVRDEGDL